jgi:hypothetical protein
MLIIGLRWNNFRQSVWTPLLQNPTALSSQLAHLPSLVPTWLHMLFFFNGSALQPWLGDIFLFFLVAAMLAWLKAILPP